MLNFPMYDNLRGKFPAGSRNTAAFILCALIAACAVSPVEERPLRFDDPGPLPALAYYQMLSRMTSAELGRERMVLNALPKNANTQLRMAMLFGYSRAQPDMGRSVNILDYLIKSSDPAAISLQPLSKLLADNYVERQRLEGQIERQAQQLKESQRKVAELQEKLAGLADIERTLPSPSPSPSPRPLGAGGAQ